MGSAVFYMFIEMLLSGAKVALTGPSGCLSGSRNTYLWESHIRSGFIQSSRMSCCTFTLLSTS